MEPAYIEIPDEPTVGIIKVHVMAFGLQHIGMDHRADWDFDFENKVSAEFARVFPAELQPHQIVDCRRFHRPHCPTPHIGENGWYIDKVVGNSKFVHWLRKLKQDFVYSESVHNSSHV